MRLLYSIFILLSWSSLAAAASPNVLFIAVDDLNDWIGVLGGHPQTQTPNFDRLARSGVLFTNAHCAAPACNPSRTAIFTGRSPNQSGVYDNRQPMREVLPDAKIIPEYFREHGYRAMGSGKMLHYFIDAKSWDDYFPEKSTENPLPETFYPSKRPVNLPVGGPWQYNETDWGPMPVDDEEFGGDWLVSKWVGEQLSRKHRQPFFLACGIYRPHEPWFVPAKYFEAFPLDEVQLPPGYREDDLDDLPPAGQAAGPNRYFPHIREHGQWRQGVQSYLASIAFADAMLGRVLDALESGPNKENTIVVLWSDHGWHLGEKQHWQKYTAWRVCTRVPLMVRVPPGIAAPLDAGTTAGTECNAPVNLVSLYPTLCDLCSLPAVATNDGPSLVPLLADAKAEWPHHSVTFLNRPESYGMSSPTHRYIHYANGDEELYDTAADRYEWNNLATKSESRELLEAFRAAAPRDFAEFKKPSVESLVKLKLQPLEAGQAPPSKPDGGTFTVYFTNSRTEDVELSWIDREGKPKSYGTIAAGKRQSQQTRPGAVWLVSSVGDSAKPLGYFEIGDRTAEAVIPD